MKSVAVYVRLGNANQEARTLSFKAEGLDISQEVALATGFAIDGQNLIASVFETESGYQHTMPCSGCEGEHSTLIEALLCVERNLVVWLAENDCSPIFE